MVLLLEPSWRRERMRVDENYEDVSVSMKMWAACGLRESLSSPLVCWGLLTIFKEPRFRNRKSDYEARLGRSSCNKARWSRKFGLARHVVFKMPRGFMCEAPVYRTLSKLARGQVCGFWHYRKPVSDSVSQRFEFRFSNLHAAGALRTRILLAPDSSICRRSTFICWR